MKSSKTAYKIGEFTVRCKKNPVDSFMRENRQRIKSENVAKGVR
tara:strand:- start:1405 stop:1536 length:132 start_codon:yes stop_codon:yes gene_type:complete